MGSVDRARAVKAELARVEEAVEAPSGQTVLAALAGTWMHQWRKKALDSASALAERLTAERKAVEEKETAAFCAMTREENRLREFYLRQDTAWAECAVLFTAEIEGCFFAYMLDSADLERGVARFYEPGHPDRTRVGIFRDGVWWAALGNYGVICHADARDVARAAAHVEQRRFIYGCLPHDPWGRRSSQPSTAGGAHDDR